MIKKYSKKSSAGFTLVELLVAVGILALIILIVTSIYVNSLKSQRENILFQEVQDNGRYIMEMITKEIRMSKIDTNYTGQAADTLEIVKNDTGEIISYSFDENSNNVFRTEGNNPRLQINSENVKITNFKFYVSELSQDFINSRYHRVTMTLSLESKTDSTVKVDLQTTITSRPSPCPSGVCAPL